MTRIGFAYNQKPESEAGCSASQSETTRPEDEPPSRCRDVVSRNFQSPASKSTDARETPVVASVPPTAPVAPVVPAAQNSTDAYAEWDSPQTIDAVADALAEYGQVIRLEADASFPERLRAEHPDIVFNIAEGLNGVNREAHVPAICEFYGTPYSGSDPFTLSLCLHKGRTKDILAHNGVPTAPFVVVESPEDLGRALAGRSAVNIPSESQPLFVKPVHEGSSKGITERNFVRSPHEMERQVLWLLETYRQPVLVEHFLPGAEFTCGVLGNTPHARVLPLVAMNFEALPPGAVPIYGFEAKWVWDARDRPLAIFECPARIPHALQSAVERVVLDTYRLLGCRDWARVDVRLDADGTPNVVEVNPLPGILPDPADNSCLPKAARAAGIQYDELIQQCLLHAAGRAGLALSRRRMHRVRSEAVA